jgi:hypothetical protein
MSNTCKIGRGAFPTRPFLDQAEPSSFNRARWKRAPTGKQKQRINERKT